MASDKRDFVAFDKFPGKLNEGTGYYEFPLLTYKDALDHKRSWQIFVRLVFDGKRVDGVNWNEVKESQALIKPEYFNVGEKIPPNIIGQMWSVSGIDGGKMTKSSPTYFDMVSFKGNSNERNVFQVALIAARSDFIKKQERSAPGVSAGKKYFPMLARPQKDGERFIRYPAYIQPKLDGVRCVVYLDNNDDCGTDEEKISAVVAYTRTKKDFPSINYIKLALYDYLKDLYDEEKNESIYLDGELYLHGKKLQDISGDARNEVSSDRLNQYHIYDLFYPSQLDMPFSRRHLQIVEIFSAMRANGDDSKYVYEVPTELVDSRDAAETKFRAYVREGYEGAILRNADGPYLANAEQTGSFMRSRDLVKLKKKFSAEFEVVGFSEGRGRDKSAVIWRVVTADGVEFNVTPNLPIDERKRLYAMCVGDPDVFVGQMLTVEYEDLSSSGVPQRAKGIEFRDFDYQGG